MRTSAASKTRRYSASVSRAERPRLHHVGCFHAEDLQWSSDGHHLLHLNGTQWQAEWTRTLQEQSVLRGFYSGIIRQLPDTTECGWKALFVESAGTSRDVLPVLLAHPESTSVLIGKESTGSLVLGDPYGSWCISREVIDSFWQPASDSTVVAEVNGTLARGRLLVLGGDYSLVVSGSNVADLHEFVVGAGDGAREVPDWIPVGFMRDTQDVGSKRRERI